MRIHKIRTHKITLSLDLTAHPTFIDVVVGYITGAVTQSSLASVNLQSRKVETRNSLIWQNVIRKVSLTWGDQQFVVDIAILSAAYSKRCTMSVYSFHGVVISRVDVVLY